MPFFDGTGLPSNHSTGLAATSDKIAYIYVYIYVLDIECYVSPLLYAKQPRLHLGDMNWGDIMILVAEWPILAPHLKWSSDLPEPLW